MKSPHPAPYKIALIQMDCTLGDKEGNIRKAQKQITEAAQNGAKLICLPEAFNSGYLGSAMAQMMDMAEPVDGPAISQMQALARQLAVFILAPIFCTVGKGVENTAVLIDDEGEIVGRYSKTHPVGDERKYLQRGEDYPVWETKLGRIGVVICYDVCFPETVRILALKGAELVLVPSAWRASYYFKEWWDINLPCRALDNLLFVAAVNRTGLSGDEIFAGKTQVCDPIGTVLAACGVEEETILYETIDISRVEKERAFNTVLADRFPEDYETLLKEYEEK